VVVVSERWEMVPFVIVVVGTFCRMVVVVMVMVMVRGMMTHIPIITLALG